jgi:hypothetical protein
MRSAIKILRPASILILAIALLPSLTFAQYTRTDLTSNQTGVAPNTSQHLVNAWGLVQLKASPTMASPFWVSDNGSGFSTLYDGTGALQNLFVTIPPAPGSPGGTLGTPTGIVGNISPNFVITENGNSGPSIFIFATLDGTISGWNPTVDGIDPITGLSHATIPMGPIGRLLALFTQAWRSRSTHLVKLSYTPPMMVRTEELICSTAPLT